MENFKELAESKTAGITNTEELMKIANSELNHDVYSWIEHNGKKVLSIDAPGLDGDVIAYGIYFLCDIYKSLPDGFRLLTMFNGTDSNFNSNTNASIKAFKPIAATVNSKVTIFGLNKIQRIFMNAIKRGYYFAETRDQSLEWLTTE